MKIGIPKEQFPGECRVACVPDEVKKLIQLGYDVLVESGAGNTAGFLDTDYKASGATCIDSAEQLWKQTEIIIKVRAPQQHNQSGCHEADWLDSGKTLISFIWPVQNPELMTQLTNSGATVLAMDSVPRISRAQKLDALSSMANIAGYRSVIEASNNFGRFFAGQITAAGRIPPAKVLVIGAGVAGLAAIGTAGSLGAMVSAFDTRPEVKEQIESLNAKFLELEFAEDGSGEGGYAKVMSEEFIRAEMALFAEQAKQVDIIITTALIPGKPATKLITKEMVTNMRAGSVIVDLAAEQGGNCEYTQPDKVVKENDVIIIGYTDFPSRMANQSSVLYAANVRHLLTDMTAQKDGILRLNLEDEVIRGTTIIHDNQVIWPAPAPKRQMAAKKAPATVLPVAKVEANPKKRALITLAGMTVGALAIIVMGAVAPAEFMSHFSVFVLACLVGWQVVWNVSPALHTPLVSVTNAISGIIVIGALQQTGSTSIIGVVLACAAILIATINISGGFLVTQRMLNMFRKI